MQGGEQTQTQTQTRATHTELHIHPHTYTGGGGRGGGGLFQTSEEWFSHYKTKEESESAMSHVTHDSTNHGTLNDN